jgi:hypothetical protein
MCAYAYACACACACARACACAYACACACAQHAHSVFSTPCARHVQAWSPLGNGRLTRFLRDSADAKQACAEVGAKYGKTAYQVTLRSITTNPSPSPSPNKDSVPGGATVDPY